MHRFNGSIDSEENVQEHRTLIEVNFTVSQ